MCLKWLQKHRRRQKINKAKVLQVKITRASAHARVAKSAASENNIMCMCRVLISAEKVTFQHEKCLAMLFKEWTMSSVHPSNSGCTWIVGRALRQLEMLSTVPQASLTLPSCSPNYPCASRIGWTHARHCPFLKQRSHKFI